MIFSVPINIEKATPEELAERCNNVHKTCQIVILNNWISPVTFYCPFRNDNTVKKCTDITEEDWKQLLLLEKEP